MRNGNTYFRNSKTFKSLYITWRDMKDRCNNKNNNRYRFYGGKGIKVCDEWQEFKNFLFSAIRLGWQTGLTIDRIDSNLDYCESNCQWLTRKENSKKRWKDKVVCVK